MTGKDWPYLRKPPVARPVTVREIWFQVARIREKNGDKEGAARARCNARIQPNQELRRKFSKNVRISCFVWRDTPCSELCQQRAVEEGKWYCVREENALKIHGIVDVPEGIPLPAKSLPLVYYIEGERMVVGSTRIIETEGGRQIVANLFPQYEEMFGIGGSYSLAHETEKQ